MLFPEGLSPLLQQHTDLKSLLGGKELHIAIKQHALELPIILASSPKGLTLDTSEPASAEGIGSYIHRRALNIGLHPSITGYA